MDPASQVHTESLRGSGAFNQLLCQLRSVYEEVCARNNVLELQARPECRECSLESKMGDPWLPINFLAPRDSPAPNRPPWKLLSPAWHHPSPAPSSSEWFFNARATEVLTREQECLSRTVDHLARQQEHLSQQISKIDYLARQQEHLSQQISKIDYLARQQEQLSQQISQMLVQNVTATPAAESRSSTRSSTNHVSELHRADSEVSRGSNFSGRGNSERFAVKTAHLSDIHRLASDASCVSRVSAISGRNIERFRVKTGNTREFGDAPTKQVELGIAQSVKESRIVEKLGWRKYLRLALTSPVFSCISSVLIMSYAGLIAIETDLISQDPAMVDPTIKIMHYVYTFAFCIELMVRCAAEGWATFCGHDACWNRLDAFLIFSGLTEMFLENALGSANAAGSVMRFVRIGRVIRTVRLIRTFRQFHDFQKMAYALISSFRTLVCSLAILVFVMLFFAVWLTQSAADLDARRRIQDLGLRYGSLMSTTYTLFLSVANGISWDACFVPLHELSWMSAQVFILYIIIVTFGVLNVVTSVFVESVIRSVQHHKDLIVQDKEEEKVIAAAHVREVFRQVDQDGSGQVSIEEMEFFLKNPELRKYMDALDIQADDTRLLFRLLDLDDSGVISADEFCEGCLRLKGNAKSIDIHTLSFRVTNFLYKWQDFTVYVEDSFTQIRKGLSL